MKLSSLFFEVVEIFVIALVIFFAVHFMVQNFSIDGCSMEPNLHGGCSDPKYPDYHQYVLVNKTAYWFGHNPKRGDVIVFQAPDRPSDDRVKRVIGLPGETVEVRTDGSVYINGQKLEEPYLPPNHGGASYGPKIVPEGEYFVMGDNRSVSYDSREIGPIPRNKIIGKAWLIIWPLHDWGSAPNKSLELAASTT
jgi:signal peptidase I